MQAALYVFSLPDLFAGSITALLLKFAGVPLIAFFLTMSIAQTRNDFKNQVDMFIVILIGQTLFVSAHSILITIGDL